MPTCRAPPTGFEPAPSTVTGWRAIRSLSEGVFQFHPKHPAGIEPARPRWKRGVIPFRHGCVCPVPHYHLGSPLVEYPRQESNLVCDLRKVACARHTPRTGSTPTRSRTWATTFGKSRASVTPSGQSSEAPGGNRTRVSTLARWRDGRSTTGTSPFSRGGRSRTHPNSFGRSHAADTSRPCKHISR